MAKFNTSCIGVVRREEKVLMVKEGKARAQGAWALPGGGLEEDEKLRECVEREIEEETGLETEAEELIATYVMEDDRGERMFAYAFNCRIKGETGKRKDDSVEEAKFIQKPDIKTLNLRYPEEKEIINDSKKTGEVPAVKYL